MTTLPRKKTITALAMEAGFSHLGHFHETFKLQTGMTPRQWRSLNTNDALPRMQLRRRATVAASR